MPAIVLTSRDGHPIKTFKDWERFGKPAAERHWKPGRSAYEVARAWIRGEACEHTRELLTLSPALAGLDFLSGVVEKKTVFDEIPRGPRNHDLLLEATRGGDRVVVAVEAKADEPFDLPLWLWRAKRIAASPGSDAPRRLDRLTKPFFGTRIDTDDEYPPIACIGYQLVSGLAGLLADAKGPAATHGVLLIHEFVSPLTVHERRAVNARVLDDFVVRLKGCQPRRISSDRGWITEPIRVRGAGPLMPRYLDISVAKLVTRVRLPRQA